MMTGLLICECFTLICGIFKQFLASLFAIFIGDVEWLWLCFLLHFRLILPLLWTTVYSVESVFRTASPHIIVFLVKKSENEADQVDNRKW